MEAGGGPDPGGHGGVIVVISKSHFYYEEQNVKRVKNFKTYLSSTTKLLFVRCLGISEFASKDDSCLM